MKSARYFDLTVTVGNFEGKFEGKFPTASANWQMPWD